MNNQELELKIKDILKNKNFFDMIEAAATFEKEYKTTTFYKSTKMKLFDVIKNAKMWYSLQLDDAAEMAQGFINKLDFTKINEIFEQMSSVFEQENSDILNTIVEFKEIVK